MHQPVNMMHRTILSGNGAIARALPARNAKDVASRVLLAYSVDIEDNGRVLIVTTSAAQAQSATLGVGLKEDNTASTEHLGSASKTTMQMLNLHQMLMLGLVIHHLGNSIEYQPPSVNPSARHMIADIARSSRRAGLITPISASIQSRAVARAVARAQDQRATHAFQ